MMNGSTNAIGPLPDQKSDAVSQRPELVVLAPAEPHRVYTDCLRVFVELGLWFPFADDYTLPRELPEDLEGVRCVVIDPARRTEFEREPAAGRLRDFERAGGLIFRPDPAILSGGAVGDSVVRHAVLRAVNAAGLTAPHPQMIARLQAMDDGALIDACRRAASDELGQYARMGMPFTDPVGMWTMVAAVEAAEFFGDSSLAEPVWSHIAAHYPEFGAHFDSHGARYILRYAERSGDRRPLEHVLRACSGTNAWPRRWRMDGVTINCDLTVPDGCDPDAPPPAVRANAWTWPENALIVGETFPMLTRATGEPAYLERAVTHILGAHRWLFDASSGLYWHVGRPGGPDRRSAPWARGDSHFLWAIREVLDLMPADHPRRAELIQMLRLNLDGLLRVQQDSGLWLNVLDATPDESRPDTSATSQFVRIYAGAYAKGWLRDERIPPMVERAWLGLKTRIWEHRFVGWCVGTSHGLSRQGYLARPHDSFRVSRSATLHTWIEIQRMRAAAGVEHQLERETK
jgi:hypothetical protein